MTIRRVELLPAPPLIALVIGPDGPLITVDGRAYTPEQLARALQAAERPTKTAPDRGTLPRQVTIAEAADMMGYSRRFVEALLMRGELQSVGAGRARRIPVAAIERWQKVNANG